MEPTLTLLYFERCPHWREAESRARQALREVGLSEEALGMRRVEALEDAERLSFRGSPTLLVDGEDPFTDPGAPVGLACRVYPTSAGPAGAPSVEELTAALRSAM